MDRYEIVYGGKKIMLSNHLIVLYILLLWLNSVLFQIKRVGEILPLRRRIMH